MTLVEFSVRLFAVQIRFEFRTQTDNIIMPIYIYVAAQSLNSFVVLLARIVFENEDKLSHYRGYFIKTLLRNLRIEILNDLNQIKKNNQLRFRCRVVFLSKI